MEVWMELFFWKGGLTVYHLRRRLESKEFFGEGSGGDVQGERII